MPGAYLDHAATTPMRPEAVAAVAPLQGEVFGNPSGSHRWAREARRRLDDARDVVAEAVGARPSEVVFTSGGTEADNLAIAGVLAAAGGRALCSATEHHAVLEPVRAAGGRTVAVDPLGRVDFGALEAELAEPGAAPVAVVSALLANNELGTVQDLAPLRDLLDRLAPTAVLHTDAVAAAAWLELPARVAPAQLVSLSGHKVGGPQGIGALVVRSGTALAPILRGGGQEHERRSGTPDVAGAVGFAAALAATVAERAATVARVEALRARLVAGLLAAAPDAVVVSPSAAADRTAGTVHVCFPGVEREALLFLLDQAGVGASWGASCSSGATEPSHVLAAIGVAPELAAGALRLSLGWCSTEADVDVALGAVPAAVRTLRGAVVGGSR
ncbi:cysteine desulfurase [Aquihabitans sp. G128]|uniref:cysteine desulfurase family protein n=1 Tax=Aquihabitans sp. G128 TaxID=2849779 RepID=UPI001C21B833|nr:cysteine desulfurase family protein [Aquihabitans sp. G128]QXC63122.1 cysteine desulfurase [Aquihabitans sp. G128]